MNKKQETWFTSDEHYYHRNICKYAGRPFNSIDEMKYALINNHNSMVNDGDIVWHLGDFAFAKIEQIESVLRQLKGNHWFCRGNHDKEILNNMDQLLNKGLFKGWDKDAEIHVNGQFIVLHHYGKRVWNKYHHGAWQLFGHSHNKLPPYGKSVDVGVDSTWITGQAEYRPFSFTELKRYMDKREIEYADMHGKQENME